MSVATAIFLFQAEDGIRALVRSRGLGDVYKRQALLMAVTRTLFFQEAQRSLSPAAVVKAVHDGLMGCLLYTSDAADERSSVDLGGRRIIKKKTAGKLEGARGE